MRRFACFIVLSLVAASALSACTTRRGGRPRDGGPGGRDGGTVRFDGGPITIRDGGGPRTDSGTSSGCVPACTPPNTCVDGRCVPPSSSCRSMPVSPATGVFCSTATRTCTEGCADSDCLFACLEADPSPDCVNCAANNIIACFTAMGCQSQWDCYATCAEDFCPAGSPETCIESSCPSERAAWTSCQSSVGTACGTEWVSCLP